ncbi:hypothetical protein BDN70DRAFT_993351 [Pholiota conissans]|uniref:DUF6534 domain-containing protein n=1 Tax=Pholiota conissans TaxID=109636 RepID=A0A9P5Z554_9AGAR|nr:hypothetical protein BDN70DRAFT_993351 [Pholiota conissans]
MNSTMDSDASSALSSIPITQLTTPPFVAIIANWGLFGALSVQVYSYFQAFPKDRTALKALVYGVYILELAQTLLLTDTMWNAFGKSFGDPEELNDTGTTWLSIFLIGGLVALLVQVFYVYRIFVISRNKMLARIIIFFAVCSFAGALATAIQAEGTGEYSDVAKLIGPMSLWIGVGSSVDVIIVGCMWYYLRKRIQRTPFAQTHALVSKVILLTIETGALTASVSIIALVLFFSTPTFFEAPIATTAKVYSTTMLAVLNSRATFGSMPQPASWMDTELTLPSNSASAEPIKVDMSPTSSTSSQHTANGVFVAKEVITVRDFKEQMV